MASDLKTSLFSMLQEQKDAYMLWDLTYPSFVRKSGWKTDLSASDCVEALGAMLEAATGVRLDFTGAIDGRRALMGTEAGVGQGAGHHDAATQHGGREEWSQGIKGWVEKGREGEEQLRQVGAPGEDEGMSEKEVREKRDKDEADARRRNFWFAWDALDPEECVSFPHSTLSSFLLTDSALISRSTHLLRQALPLSMALHRSVLSQGSFILDKQSLRTLRTYRLAVVKDGPDLPVFQHPATLLRLAHWLTDQIRNMLEQQSGAAGGGGMPKGKNLPLVLAALNEGSDKFLVVGVVPAEEYGDVRKKCVFSPSSLFFSLLRSSSFPSKY